MKDWKRRIPLENHDQANRREKRRARSAAQKAVKDGKIARRPCESCGEPKAEMHHDDHTKPFDVRWLCLNCHRACHVAIADKEHLAKYGHEPNRDAPNRGKCRTCSRARDKKRNTENEARRAAQKVRTREYFRKKHAPHLAGSAEDGRRTRWVRQRQEGLP